VGEVVVMDVSGPGAWLDLEEAQGERFLRLADHLTRLSDGALTRIDARDREWTGALEGVMSHAPDWTGRYGDAFRSDFDKKGRGAVESVRRGRDGFAALADMARTARRIGEAIDAAHLDHRNRLQAALGVGDEWVQRGWTNAQDLVGNLPGPLGALGESDEDAERARQAMDAANRSREIAEEAVRAQLQAWNHACAGYATAVTAAIDSFRAAMPDPPPAEDRPWWREYLVDPLLVDPLLDFKESLRMLFTPEAMRAVGETLGGLLLLVAGAGGEVGGGALDITGVGATVGVPINIASWGLITGGAVLTSKGIVDYLDAMNKGDYSYNRRAETAPEREIPDADPVGDRTRHPDAHTDTKHVGRSDQQLVDRLDREMGPRWRRSGPDPNVPRKPTESASTYRTNGDAQRFAQRVFDEKRADIVKWLDRANPGSTKTFEADMGEVTGRNLTRDAWQSGEGPGEVTGARVVLRADPSAPGGFYILTSFPVP
jgi:hypothetical protein